MNKPILLDFEFGMRAKAIALTAVAQQEHLSLEQMMCRAEHLGINPEHPQIKQFVLEHYSGGVSTVRMV